jgi:hypothetical protein
MDAERGYESFSTTINDLDDRLAPMSRCMNIGIGGGCGLRCAAFCDGECEEPYEFDSRDVFDEFDADEIKEILEYYPKFMQDQALQSAGREVS